MIDYGLKDRVALVTGANNPQGIGAIYGLIFCITIIGIPFGKMHFRLAKLALSPFGKELV